MSLLTPSYPCLLDIDLKVLSSLHSQAVHGIMPMHIDLDIAYHLYAFGSPCWCHLL